MNQPDPPLDRGAFTGLERQVLKAVAAQCPDQEDKLLAQFRAATVVSRENSGVGFFTDFEVDRLQAGPTALPSPVGNVWLDVSGFQDQMVFLVFLHDGYAVMLEGATIRDSTVGVDLSKLTVCSQVAD